LNNPYNLICLALRTTELTADSGLTDCGLLLFKIEKREKDILQTILLKIVIESMLKLVCDEDTHN